MSRVSDILQTIDIVQQNYMRHIIIQPLSRTFKVKLPIRIGLESGWTAEQFWKW
jgi:hypothetical protein